MPTLAEVVLPHTSQTFAVTQPNNFGDETHLDGRVVSALSSRQPPLLNCSLRLSLPVQLLRRARKRSNNTSVITVIH